MTPDLVVSASENLHASLQQIRKIAPFLALAVLRLICNGWCISSRFGQDPDPCAFCNEDGGDCIRHYIHCTKVKSVLSSLGLPWDEHVMCLGPPAVAPLPLLRAVATDVVQFAVQAARRKCDATLAAEARVRALSRRHQAIHYVLYNGG